MLKKLEVFNEVTTMTMVYVMMCFSDANQAYEGSKLGFDMAFTACIAVNLLVHLSLLVKDSVVRTKDRIKAKCCKPRKCKSQ